MAKGKTSVLTLEDSKVLFPVDAKFQDTGFHLELLKNKNGKVFYRLVHSNGNIIMTSESYEVAATATRGAKNLAKKHYFVLYKRYK